VLAALRARESGLGGREETIPRHDGDGVGVVEEVGDLVGGEQDVERHDGGAGIVGAEVGDGEVGNVRDQQRHVLAPFDAEGPQPSGELPGVQVERLVGQPPVSHRQRRFPRVGLGALT